MNDCSIGNKVRHSGRKDKHTGRDVMNKEFHPAFSARLKEYMLNGLTIVYALGHQKPDVDRLTTICEWTAFVKSNKCSFHSLLTAHIPW